MIFYEFGEKTAPVILLTAGSALCALFAGLIFKTFRLQNRENSKRKQAVHGAFRKERIL